MRDFYRENETDGTPYKTNEEYLQLKRKHTLEVIKPICDVFGIADYDYDVANGHERLVLDGQSIGCSCNSMGAILDELMGYLFVNSFGYDGHMGAFKKQTLNEIKRYWINGDKE